MIGPDFIFIEPPKNATTSISKWIADEGYPYYEGFKRHTPAPDLMGVLKDEFWANTFKFSVYRNPYDRLTSEFLYFKLLSEAPSDAQRGKSHTLRAEKIFSEISTFSEFVDMAGTNCFLNRYLMSHTQTRFFGEEDIFLCDFRNLQRDFDVICGKLGWKPSPLPKYNASVSRAPWETFYTEEVKRKVKALFAEDFITPIGGEKKSEKTVDG